MIARFLSQQGFLICLGIVLILAYGCPFLLGDGGWLPGREISKCGVFVIFLLQGAFLPFQQLASAGRPMRLFVFVLAWNFVLFPLVVFLLDYALFSMVLKEFIVGFWLLSILPTTVSSAVLFSSLAGGSVGHAVFSSVLSNVVAVGVVPLWGALYFSSKMELHIPLLPLFSSLFFMIILPMLIGQLLRRFWARVLTWVEPSRKVINNGIILLIVHVAFANSMQSSVFAEVSYGSSLLVIGATVLLLLVISCLVWSTSGCLRLTPEQRISAFFCGSQKSIITGLPLLSVLLLAAENHVDSGFALLPLLCYHPAQLLLASVLANRWKSHGMPRAK